MPVSLALRVSRPLLVLCLLVAGAAGAQTPPPAANYADPQSWLCRPGRADLCSAGQAVTAREALLLKLVAAAQAYLDGQLTVEEAAAALGRHPETIRRAVRKGTLPDGRATPRGRHRIRRGDLDRLAAPRSGAYDPVADAQDIAGRRRPL